MRPLLLSACIFLGFAAILPADDLSNAILTPPALPSPRINGPSVFGVRPGSAFLYTLPVSGERPIRYSVEGLPAGLAVDPATGFITGKLSTPGEYSVILKAQNTKGNASRKFRIVCGDRIALTPPMGWNSWNALAQTVNQEKVLHAAQTMASTGLTQYGWSYINIDDTWQGQRSGPDLALQGNEKFPDMKKLVDGIHALGLKAGIYSTPWETSYAKFPGGSSEAQDGVFKKIGWKMGQVSFAKADAKQWSDWGIDYLKYDWHPIDIEHVREMSEALKALPRDIVYSLSNTADFDNAEQYANLANCWRTTMDIYDRWKNMDRDKELFYAVSEIAFSQDRWAPHGGPSHWNDPDMLVLGHVGWGEPHPTRLTADQQYAHFSMWCMLSAPLLIGCDMEKLDPFTLSLLSNSEVIALDQDALGRSATRLATDGPIDVYVKELEDGSRAVGFFNRSPEPYSGTFTKLRPIGITGKHNVRDLWRQQDLPDCENKISIAVPADGVLLLRFTNTVQ